MSVPKPVVVLLCVLPWAAVLVVLAWFVSVRYPSSTFVAEGHFDGNSVWANPFLPAERASSPGLQPGGWTGQSITDDPVYFTARVPGIFQSVDVDLDFRPVRQPLVEFGLVRDAAGLDLELHPAYDADLMDPSWTPVTQDGVSGFTRNGADLTQTNEADNVAVWDASTTWPDLVDPPVATSTSYAVSLRGSHDFYVVPAGDNIQMTFTLQAVNRATGTDVVAIRVLHGDDEISRDSFDANGSLDTRMDSTFTYEVDVPKAKPGVYHIALTAQDDVFIRGIKTNTTHLVVGPRFVLGDTVGYLPNAQPVDVWTNSRHLDAEIVHPDATQTIMLASSSLALTDTHIEYRLNRTDSLTGIARLSAPKGNVRFIGDGYFSFTPESFFEPTPRRLDDSTQLVQEGIDVVRTPFVRPDALGDGWYRLHQTFTLSGDMPTLRFVLSAPGVSSRAAAVDVRDVRLTYRRTPVYGLDWFKLILTEFVHAAHRL